MKLVGTPLGAALIGSLPAGPFFVTAGAAELLYAEMPRAIAIDLPSLAFFLIALIFSLIPGMFLAFLPNLLGSSLMARLGETSETARDPLAWLAAGTAAGAGLAALFAGFEEGAGIAVALIVTSAGCACLCRTQIDWVDHA